MADNSAAVRLTCQALGFVLDLDPDQLRADTPLADIGADSVAVLACADILEAGVANMGLRAIDDESVRTARTVGDLSDALPPLPEGFRS